MKRIAELRKEKHLTQIGLALKLNLSQKMISAYESGRHQPSVETLIQMSKIFNVSVDYIIGNTNFKRPAEYYMRDRLSQNEAELLSIFSELDAITQQKAIGVLFAYIHMAELQSAVSPTDLLLS